MVAGVGSFRRPVGAGWCTIKPTKDKTKTVPVPLPERLIALSRVFGVPVPRVTEMQLAQSENRVKLIAYTRPEKLPRDVDTFFVHGLFDGDGEPLLLQPSGSEVFLSAVKAHAAAKLAYADLGSARIEDIERMRVVMDLKDTVRGWIAAKHPAERIQKRLDRRIQGWTEDCEDEEWESVEITSEEILAGFDLDPADTPTEEAETEAEPEAEAKPEPTPDTKLRKGKGKKAKVKAEPKADDTEEDEANDDDLFDSVDEADVPDE